ncbi:MAG: hypothetical protein ABI718_14795 [Acidobacteriota bacterium]
MTERVELALQMLIVATQDPVRHLIADRSMQTLVFALCLRVVWTRVGYSNAKTNQPRGELGERR